MKEAMKYPRRVEFAIRGCHFFTTVQLALATKALIIGRPIRVVLVLFAFAIVPEIFSALYKKKVLERGCVNWTFKVLANSCFYYKNKKIDYVLAVSYVSPYTEKIFEIIMNKGEKLPEIGSMVDICFPGDVKIYEAENRYIVGGYYEMVCIEAY